MIGDTDLRWQDVIDSRDVIARIEYLAPETDPVDVEEYRALIQLQEEAESSPDWLHGKGLIRDSHFQEYTQELAEDIGAVDSTAPWPVCYIDWERAADALKKNYMSVDFDGVEYWIRA